MKYCLLSFLLMIGSAMGQTKLPPKQSSIPPLPRCHDLFAARNTIMPGADQNVHIYSTEINGQACIPDPHPTPDVPAVKITNGKKERWSCWDSSRIVLTAEDGKKWCHKPVTKARQ